MEASIVQAYSQGGGGGGDLPYFVGKQYGSGWLRTIGRFAFPLIKRAMKVFGNTAEDVLVNEKPVLTSLRDNALNELSIFKGNGVDPMAAATGVTTMIPPTSINGSRKRRRRTSTKQQPPPLEEEEVR